MTTSRFLASELPLQSASSCRFHILPIPYEASVSYGSGTANGPAAIIEASNQLEVHTGLSIPSTQGIYTWPFVDCTGSAEQVIERIATATKTILASGPQKPLPTTPPPAEYPCTGAATIPIALGGEHSVTYGVLQALKEQYGTFGVIQFDAHADLRDTYSGTPYSHACVMRRAVADLGLPLFQIGVRSASPQELAFRQEANVHFADARTLCCPRNWAKQDTPPFALPSAFPKQVFLTFDIDALDASLMPATGTPEPGGLLWWDTIHLIRLALNGRVLLGADVVELAPLSYTHAPTYTAARLVHEIMGMVAV